jgi:alginate O-acetyltransferase complex protein AlgI
LFKIKYIAGTLLFGWISSNWPDIHSEPGQFTWCQIYIFIIINFLGIYINFSGYTDIAVGTAKLFSITIRENFNLPIIAGNIQEFWRRWHMTLGDWVIRNLYFTMIRQWGMIFIPIIITFVLVGLWHKFSLNYLVWGAGHGVALAVVQYIHRKGRFSPFYQRLSKNIFYRFSGWAITLSFVSWLSAFANARSFEAGLRLTARIFGIYH